MEKSLDRYGLQQENDGSEQGDNTGMFVSNDSLLRPYSNSSQIFISQRVKEMSTLSYFTACPLYQTPSYTFDLKKTLDDVTVPYPHAYRLFNVILISVV